MTKKICFFDFDATLIKSPLPETGKDIWKEKHGVDYPHLGWWGKEESLCLTAFDIKPNEEVLGKLLECDKNVLTVLLTNRISRMETAVKAVIKHNDIKIDVHSFKYGRETKGQRIASFLDRYEDVKEVDFYDDIVEHFTDAMFLYEKYPTVDFNFFLVDENGKIKEA